MRMAPAPLLVTQRRSVTGAKTCVGSPVLCQLAPSLRGCLSGVTNCLDRVLRGDAIMRPWKFWLLTVLGAAVVSAVPGVGGGLAVAVLIAAFVMRTRGRPRRPAALSGPPPTLPGVKGTEVSVVGTGYYDGIDDLNEGADVAAELRRDHGNQHDPNAVAVWAGSPLQMTGFLPRELAAIVGPRMDTMRTQASRTVGHLRDGAVRVLVPTPLDEGLGRNAMGTSDAKLWPTMVSPWGRAAEYLEVEDEYKFRGQVASVFALSGVELGVNGSSLECQGALALSSADPDTIFVVVSGYTVGRLGHDDVRRYREQVAIADAAQTHIPVSMRLWARDDEGIIRSRASVQVCAPNLIQPPAKLPDGAYVVLPHGTKVQVTGEDAHLAELAAILAGRPEVAVVATLHEAPPVGRATKTRVEVRIEDQRVGALSPTMAEHFLPTVQAASAVGLLVVCRASVVGSSLKADVILDAAKSGDLTQEWIAENLSQRASDKSDWNGSAAKATT